MRRLGSIKRAVKAAESKVDGAALDGRQQSGLSGMNGFRNVPLTRAAAVKKNYVILQDILAKIK